MPDISATLVSNSDQLDNVDLMGGARVFTITDVTITGGEQPLRIGLAEYERPWKPGVTMRRLLSGIWGSESDEWIGRKVRLYRDETVKFGPARTGGTRVSHATHIAKTITLTLPVSKGKFGEFKVEPLKDEPTPPEQPTDPTAAPVAAFAAGGVTAQQLETRIGRPRTEWTGADLTKLTDLFQTLKSGQVTKDEAFPEDGAS